MWATADWSEVREDWQAPPDMSDMGVSDVAQADASVRSMQATPLGEPPADFDVRCVYDSRPVNGYDFNFSGVATNTPPPSGAGWAVTFIVPNGYRIVPRKWEVIFDQMVSGSQINSTATLQQNNANLPNNGPIFIGDGTFDRPIESFYVCEENTTFGIAGVNSNTSAQGVTVLVNCYGNLIPVSEVALPFSVTNKRFGT